MSRTRFTPGGAGTDGFFRRVALPLSPAPRDQVSRRHRHRRGRRRVLADHAEDQGAPGLFLGLARARRSRGRRQADRHLAVLAGPRARCAGAGRVDADLLGKILRHATVRRDLAGGAARLAVPTAWRASSRGAMSNSSGSRTGGAKIFPLRAGSIISTCIRDEYYRDREVGLEAFIGRNYLFREEFTSRVWATRYDFPALRDGRVKREVIPDERPSGAQGWLLNTRREKFADRRLREAMVIAFDFEWTNKNLMYGSYERTHSVFQNSEMMAKGEPSPEEIALLEPFRDRVLPEVFGPAWVPPVSDGSGQDRKLLRSAGDLLNAAGWTVKDGKRVNAKGEQLSVEFLLTERCVRAASHHLHQEPARAGHRRQYPAGRSVAGRGADEGLRFRHRDRAFHLSANSRQCLAQLFFQRVRQDQGVQQPRRASPIPSSMRWSKRRLRRKARPNSIPPAGRSIACCARAGTGFRTGARRHTGSLIGTSSAIPRSSRAMRAARRRRGGSRPTRRPRSNRRNSP